ncbi:hypothetical protein SERLA73DRAFT_186161 [Serpula lacrymans var. lacrymans S7.3]|uniref:Uncharacterized protein n=2 Tax=Serpula lacrymans var. lacrymans TaxID=341189 RepID=F8Q5E4_SERL3|nr:uncharacterized protein SERLADRAFT_475035 [Serpula lacrymans var. lacrymans S7.9]EGN96415.1 hypothetical protein SERLA73DRAFT_186161 [Serpula lacrymans var. lacrymans S7.3]EGO21955.1 hypothetical protein SERLADRAFT_475035 [Serpula lacrymans var. lacrymans S7.9]
MFSVVAAFLPFSMHTVIQAECSSAIPMLILEYQRKIAAAATDSTIESKML